MASQDTKTDQWYDDRDNERLFQIAAWNLVRFFGYEQGAAEKLIVSFREHYRVFSPEWAENDNFYHHEGAFRSAAIMHYYAIHGNLMDFSGFHDWFRAQHFESVEQEACNYFNAVFCVQEEA